MKIVFVCEDVGSGFHFWKSVIGQAFNLNFEKFKLFRKGKNIPNPGEQAEAIYAVDVKFFIAGADSINNVTKKVEDLYFQFGHDNAIASDLWILLPDRLDEGYLGIREEISKKQRKGDLIGEFIVTDISCTEEIFLRFLKLHEWLRLADVRDGKESYKWKEPIPGKLEQQRLARVYFTIRTMLENGEDYFSCSTEGEAYDYIVEHKVKRGNGKEKISTRPSMASQLLKDLTWFIDTMKIDKGSIGRCWLEDCNPIYDIDMYECHNCGLYTPMGSRIGTAEGKLHELESYSILKDFKGYAGFHFRQKRFIDEKFVGLSRVSLDSELPSMIEYIASKLPPDCDEDFDSYITCNQNSFHHELKFQD